MTYDEFRKGLNLSPAAEQNAKLYTLPFIAAVKNALGDKIRVSSTVRTPKANAAVGGVANSKHLDSRALAVDFVPARWDRSITDVVRKIAAQHGFGYLEHDVKTGNHIHCEFKSAVEKKR